MPKKGVTKGQLSATVNKDLLVSFETHCDQEQKNKSAVIETLIHDYMEKIKKEKR